MFLGFLLFLRAGGFKVSMHDWLALMEGLQSGTSRAVDAGILYSLPGAARQIGERSGRVREPVLQVFQECRFAKAAG